MPEVKVAANGAFGVPDLNLMASGTVADVNRPLKNPEEELLLEVGGTTSIPLSIFDGQFQVDTSASADLRLKIHKSLQEIRDPFGEMRRPSDLDLSRWGEFSVTGALRAAGSGSFEASPWRFSAAAMASTELSYRHLVVLPQEVSLAKAAATLIGRARRPSHFLEGALEPGEFHEFTGRLKFDLKATAGAGFKSEFKTNLAIFDGFSPEVKVTARATFEAALGLSIFEETTFIVLRQPDWAEEQLRLRISSKKDRGLTIGVKIAIAVQHNLGDVLSRTLDHAFGLTPVADALETLQEISEYAKKIAAGSQSLNGLLESLSKKSGSSIFKRLWEGLSLGDDQKVAEFTGKVARFVDSYKSLDSKLKELWEDFLEHADVGDQSTLRSVLQEIAGFGGSSREKILKNLVAKVSNQQGQAILRLLELLTGETLEGLLSGFQKNEDDLQTAVTSAATRAKKFLDFLDEGPVQEVADRLHAFARKAGIEGVVEWLAKNASSPDAVKTAANNAVTKVVSRLFHKTVQSLGEAELRQLQSWAAKVSQALDVEKRLAPWRESIKKDLARLDQEMGFSLSFEISRQITKEAILDAKIGKPLWETISEALVKGDLPELLRIVTRADDEDPADRDSEFPISVVYECSMLSRRSRKSGWGLRLKAFGLEWLTARSSLRLVESQDKVTAIQGRQVKVRGLSELTSQDDRELWKSAMELEIASQKGSFGGPSTPGDAVLSLSIGIEDDKMKAAEAAGLDGLLVELGFVSQSNTTAADFLEIDGEARLGLKLAFSANLIDLVGAISAIPAKGVNKTEALVATKRVFDDEMVQIFHDGARTGLVLNTYLSSPDGEAAVKKGMLETISDLQAVKVVTIGTRQIRMVRGVSNAILPPYQVLRQVSALLGRVEPDASRTGKALAQLNKDANGKVHDVAAAFETLAEQVVRQHNSLNLSAYANPMVGFWIFCRRLQAGLKTRVTVRGAATLERKESGSWSAPVIWTL